MMTNEEALEQLNFAISIINRDGIDWLDERDIPVIQMAIDALKKQIPRKPKYKVEDRFASNHFAEYSYCPACENEVVAGDMFCITCGQRICWYEDDE